MPPRSRTKWQRRAITLPALFALTGAGWLLSPVLLAVALAVDSATAPRRLRTTRLTMMALAALAIETRVVTGAGLLWLRFGLLGRLHSEQSYWKYHRLQCRYTSSLMAAARRTCGLHVEVDNYGPAERGNAIVIGRHTSIGDALIPAELFATRHDINTRYVIKSGLLNESFLRPRRRPAQESLRRSCTRRQRRGARLSATPDRRTRRTQRGRHLPRRHLLHRSPQAANRRAIARRRQPRTGGARFTVALCITPASGRNARAARRRSQRRRRRHRQRRSRAVQLARLDLPVPTFRAPVRVWMWRLSREGVPHGSDARIDWLYSQWEHLDDSIHERLTAPGLEPCARRLKPWNLRRSLRERWT